MTYFKSFILLVLAFSCISCCSVESLRSDKPDPKVSIDDLEAIHKALSLLIKESNLEASYVGYIGRPANRPGLHSTQPYHSWQIYDRESKQLSSILSARLIKNDVSMAGKNNQFMIDHLLVEIDPSARQDGVIGFDESDQALTLVKLREIVLQIYK